jgi:hypothetical protein
LTLEECGAFTVFPRKGIGCSGNKHWPPVTGQERPLECRTDGNCDTILQKDIPTRSRLLTKATRTAQYTMPAYDRWFHQRSVQTGLTVSRPKKRYIKLVKGTPIPNSGVRFEWLFPWHSRPSPPYVHLAVLCFLANFGDSGKLQV